LELGERERARTEARRALADLTEEAERTGQVEIYLALEWWSEKFSDVL
jgi:hypothetical protein